MTTIQKTLSNVSVKDLASELIRREADLSRREAVLQNKQDQLRDKLTRMATDLNDNTVKVFGKEAAAALASAEVPAAPNGAAKKRRKGKRIAIRFRDPANPKNTWTGRGKQAAWLTAAIKGGKTLDEFRVGK